MLPRTRRQPSVAQMQHNPHGSLASWRCESLRLLTFNIQTGIHTQHYGHYVTRSWQHLLPCAARQHSVQQIGHFLADFDVVALQEVDGGSWRSGFRNQVEHLAKLGHFPFWYQQANRNLGRWAQHSNGLLSRWPITQLENHPLPGPAGRGAIVAQLGTGNATLAIVATHLALGASTRAQQLAYLCKQLTGYQHVILMGDLNASVEELDALAPLRVLSLRPAQLTPTYPSWQPSRCIDHILLSDGLDVERVAVLDAVNSDHRPVAVDIRLPEGLRTPWAKRSQ